jgi:hypothetical protein
VVFFSAVFIVLIFIVLIKSGEKEKKRKEIKIKIRIVPSEIPNVVSLWDFRNFGTLKNLGLGVSK